MRDHLCSRGGPPSGSGLAPWVSVLLIGLSSIQPISASADPFPPGGWVPFECSEPLRDVRRGAEPVAPDEFPTSHVEVTRAFEAGIRDFLFDTWWQETAWVALASTAHAVGLERYVPSPRRGDSGHGTLARAMLAGEVEYRVEPVVSWEPQRCTGRPDRQGAYYLEGSWGDGRSLFALLWRSGELRQWALRGPGDAGSPPRPLVSLEDAAGTIAAEVGGPLDDVQYVLASGYPRCHGVPCVAARKGETLFLLEPHRRLFAFALDPRPEHEVLPPPGRRCLGAPCPGDPYVVRVGDHVLAGEVIGVPRTGASEIDEAGEGDPDAESELPHAFDAGWKGEPVCDVLHETEAVRIGRCSFPPGVGHEEHFHRPHFGYVLAGGTMRIEDAEGVETVETRAGATWSSDRVTVHEVVNVGDTTASYLIVEPKER